MDGSTQLRQQWGKAIENHTDYPGRFSECAWKKVNKTASKVSQSKNVVVDGDYFLKINNLLLLIL